MNNTFELLEKKLNIASSLIDELEIEDYTPELPIIVSDTGLEVHKPSVDSNEVFSLESLKTDFVLIRQNIMKLINTGQRILDSASIIDPSDMKASTLASLAQLQQTLGTNLKLLVDVYKEIGNIEKIRCSIQSKTTDIGNPNATNNGTIVNNNIVFSGDTSQLLNFMRENQNT